MFRCLFVLMVGACSQSSPPPVTPQKIATPFTPYQVTVDRIIEKALQETQGWNRLAYVTDKIGHRLSGSASLEKAIDWAVLTLEKDGQENVHKQPVKVPHWIRGEQFLEINAGFKRELSILTLGNSIGTNGTIEANLLVVRDFAELQKRKDEVNGSIVLFNAVMAPWTEEHGAPYGDVVKYRIAGPSEAEKLGAKAVLVRSITAHSLNTPHTGTLWYQDGHELPAAAITTEDADWLARLSEQKAPITAKLRLGAKFLPDADSANVMGEITGSEFPDEVIVISGHLDSWDVGQGAHDDAGGCVIAIEALRILRAMNIQPKRTIRVVLFTNEENGSRGAEAYKEKYGPNTVAAFESDNGIFALRGLRVQTEDTKAIHFVDQLLKTMNKLGPLKAESGYSGADISGLEEFGTLLLGHWVHTEHYFDYHHTAADTLDKMKPEDLRASTALTAGLAYLLAQVDELPKIAPKAKK